MNLKADPHTRFTLNDPPTRLGRVRPFPLFLSFNTFTSLLYHAFLLVLTPSFASSPLSLTFCSSPNPPFCHALFPPSPHSLPRAARRVSTRCSLPRGASAFQVPSLSSSSLVRQIANSHPSGPGALGLFNETPSTIDVSLPTPSIPVFTMFAE